MEPVACSDAYFVVNCGYTSTPVMAIGTDGSPYQSEMDLIDYALIAKDDYLNNRNNIYRNLIVTE